MSFKKKLLLVLFFILIIGGSYMYLTQDDNVIVGADDFKIDSPFSEDHYQFKDKNNEKLFIANDYEGNMLSIERLSDAEFNDLKNSWDFKNESNSLDSSDFMSHEVTIVDSSIPYLYQSMGVTSVLGEKEVQVYLIELVEVNNNTYKITIGNTGKIINDDNYDGFDLQGLGGLFNRI